MKKHSVIALLMIFAQTIAYVGTASAQDGQDKTYEFPVSDPENPVMLEVEIHNGKMIIQGRDTDTVSVVTKSRPLNEEELSSVRKQHKIHWKDPNDKKQNKTPRSREGLKPVNSAAMNMKIDQRGNRIDIESMSTTFFVEVVVTVPKMTNVEANLYRGEGISVSNLSGYLELDSWRGDITAENISGPVVAETHQSSIVVSFSEFNDASPSSLTTHSGDIDITVDNNMSANINVQNFQGEVLSGLSVPFESTEQVKRDEGSNRSEVLIGGQVTARLNNGGQDLTLITYSGGVYVRAQ